MQKEKRFTRIMKLIIADILDLVKSTMIAMLLLHIAFVDNIKDVIGINIYQVVMIYFIAAGINIVFAKALNVRGRY